MCEGVVHQNFISKIDGLHASFELLLNCEPVSIKTINKKEPIAGVYLFSEAGENHYIGRTNNIVRRYGLHCNSWSQHNQATFAFRLAREKTGRTLISYKQGADSRKGLMEDEVFAQAFKDAKLRVKNMDFRYVIESDDTKQALLEIYCAVALGTTVYNSFKTS